jgi:hypothetical protein
LPSAEVLPPEVVALRRTTHERVTALAIEQSLTELHAEVNALGPRLALLQTLEPIENVEAYRQVAAAGQAAHLLDQRIEATFAPWKSEARALHLAICAEERAYRETPLAIEKLAGDLCRAWDEAEASRQRDEEERQQILAEAHAIVEREEQLESLEAAAAATGDPALREEAAAVAAEPLAVPQTRVTSSRGRAVTRDAPKHKPTYDAKVVDFHLFAVTVVGPLVLRQIASTLGEKVADPTCPPEVRQVCSDLQTDLLRQIAQMPRVPLSALEASKAWLKVEATRTKERFAVPGCELITDTRSSFARR